MQKNKIAFMRIKDEVHNNVFTLPHVWIRIAENKDFTLTLKPLRRTDARNPILWKEISWGMRLTFFALRRSRRSQRGSLHCFASLEKKTYAETRVFSMACFHNEYFNGPLGLFDEAGTCWLTLLPFQKHFLLHPVSHCSLFCKQSKRMQIFGSRILQKPFAFWVQTKKQFCRNPDQQK